MYVALSYFYSLTLFVRSQLIRLKSDIFCHASVYVVHY